MVFRMSDAKIKIEETSLEDLIVLGEDKLIDMQIEYPTENGTIHAKTKIKQLTMKELRNIDVNNMDLETSVKILNRSLFTQNEEPFSQELILALPVGVVFAITQKIMEISGVDVDLKKP